MPTSAAMYGLLHASTDFVKLCAFGGITLGVFVISSGLVAGLYGTTPKSIRYTRIATITALVMVLIFFTVGLCTMFHSKPYQVACGVTCSWLISGLLFACWSFKL